MSKCVHLSKHMHHRANLFRLCVSFAQRRVKVYISPGSMFKQNDLFEESKSYIKCKLFIIHEKFPPRLDLNLDRWVDPM